MDGDKMFRIGKFSKLTQVSIRMLRYYDEMKLFSVSKEGLWNYRTIFFCFEETELQRLWADVHICNTASFKTLEKAGFRREGLIREGKMVNIYCDYYLYGMTKADYDEVMNKAQHPNVD